MRSRDIVWKKDENNPVICPQSGTWTDQGTMTTDIVTMKSYYYMYFVGKSQHKNSIGLATIPRDCFDGKSWHEWSENPIIMPGGLGAFDSQEVIDPAVIVQEDEIKLYYSGIGGEKDMIGLATSTDGHVFHKTSEPIMEGRSPEVVLKNGVIYLFYIHQKAGKGYAIRLATSRDGFTFQEEGTVFAPALNGWDSYTVTTPRVVLHKDIYIMTYAGDDTEADHPKGLGHAFSRDLKNWVRYAGNPVLKVGAGHDWDSKAIWFGETLYHNGLFYLWYEGSNGIKSQIGLATCKEAIGAIGSEFL